jgi:hypothetical protein
VIRNLKDLFSKLQPDEEFGNPFFVDCHPLGAFKTKAPAG